jgi:hypothetical protein
MFVTSRAAYWLQLVHLWELGQILVDLFVCLASLMEYLVTNLPEVRKHVIVYLLYNGSIDFNPVCSVCNLKLHTYICTYARTHTSEILCCYLFK